MFDIDEDSAPKLEDLDWDACGHDDPAALLFATVHFGSAAYRAEAYEVVWRPYQCQVCGLTFASHDKQSENDNVEPHDFAQGADVKRSSDDDPVPSYAEQVAAGDECSETFEQLSNAFDADGPWDTVFIGGREYVVFVCPPQI